MLRELIVKSLIQQTAGFDLIIEPGKTTRSFLLELIRYRELFFFLAWKDILVRYKQTVIGIAWSVIKPLLSMIIFTIVFGRIAKLPSGGVPYPVLVFSALLPWQYFSNAMQASAESLIRVEAMISKVYFPRLILPTSAVLVSMVDFVISFVLLCLLMLVYRFMPSARILLLPVFFVPATLAALGDWREVSRFQTHYAVYYSVWHVRFAGWIFKLDYSG